MSKVGRFSNETKTFIKKLEELGYTLKRVEKGWDIYDGYGWRAFMSEEEQFALNTCGIQLPKEVFDVLVRYSRYPVKEIKQKDSSMMGLF